MVLHLIQHLEQLKIKTMKTVLYIFALALTLSLSAGATTVSSAVKNQTENTLSSKSVAASTKKAAKTKKANQKHHKHVSGSKKNK